jgi:hypothetical protein
MSPEIEGIYDPSDYEDNLLAHRAIDYPSFELLPEVPEDFDLNSQFLDAAADVHVRVDTVLVRMH